MMDYSKKQASQKSPKLVVTSAAASKKTSKQQFVSDNLLQMNFNQASSIFFLLINSIKVDFGFAIFSRQSNYSFLGYTAQIRNLSIIIVILIYQSSSHVPRQQPRKQETYQPYRSENLKESALKSSSKNQEEIIFSNILYPSNRIHCDLCRREVTKSSKILILQGTDERKNLCFSCFANLEPYPQHYHVMNKNDFPLFEPHWSALDQLLMFEALQKHGFGNWVDIADFIGNGKCPQEVQEHYQQVYIKNHDFLPNNLTLTKRNSNNFLSEVPNQNQPRKVLKSNIKATKVHAHESKVQPANTPKVNMNPAQIVGFMPRRGDFQIQYDNDAELLLAELEFNDDDNPEDRAMKFRLMDIYNHKLSERYKRKDFIIERKLLDVRQQMRLDKTRTKDQKEIHNIMKVFARFNSAQQHENIVQGILKEKLLRQRIAEIKQLQTKGYKTLGDVQDQLENKRKKDEKSKKRDVEFTLDKSKTRRVRKQTNVQKSDKKVLYVNKNEQQLCKKLNLTFKQYMNMKETVLRESIRMGVVAKDAITGLLQVKKSISEPIFDFLVEQEGLLIKQNQPMSQQFSLPQLQLS